MNKPTINNTNAVRQAGDTIHTYLRQARSLVIELFGEEYETEHPDLYARVVIECIRSQTLDFNNTAITSALWEIKEAIESLGRSIERTFER